MDTNRRHRRSLAALMMVGLSLGGSLALFGAAPVRAMTAMASGGSIVFIKAHNVWLASPDGLTQRQLTTNGSKTTPYRNPTQSDDGNVIVAVQDRMEQQGGFARSYVYELDAQGELLRAPFAPAQYSTRTGGLCTVPVLTAPGGILAAVSPDGTKIAVNPLASFYDFDCGGTPESVVRVINLAGTIVNQTIRPPGSVDGLGFQQPAWISNTRLLLYHDLDNGMFSYDLGASTATLWRESEDFADNAYMYPSLRAGKLATTGGDANGDRVLRLWTASGPPTQPTARCDIPNPDPTRYDWWTFEFVMPRVAPDGGAIVWQEVDRTGSVPVNNLYISPIGAIGSGCSSLGRHVFIAGGSDPYWGPAGMATRDTTPPTVPTITAPRAAFQKALSFAVAWGGSIDGAGPVTYDVRYRAAAAGAELPTAYTPLITATVATSKTISGTAGTTYCYSARARDGASPANLSMYSAERCTAVPLDDRVLAIPPGTPAWTSATGSAYYLGTYRRSTAAGATLKKTGLVAKSIVLVATRCSGCGTLKATWKTGTGAVSVTIPLDATSKATKQMVSLFTLPSIQTGTLIITVTSSGKLVEVDGVGVSKG